MVNGNDDGKFEGPSFPKHAVMSVAWKVCQYKKAPTTWIRA